MRHARIDYRRALSSLCIDFPDYERELTDQMIWGYVMCVQTSTTLQNSYKSSWLRVCHCWQETWLRVMYGFSIGFLSFQAWQCADKTAKAKLRGSIFAPNIHDKNIKSASSAQSLFEYTSWLFNKYERRDSRVVPCCRRTTTAKNGISTTSYALVAHSHNWMERLRDNALQCSALKLFFF